jgi:uncharacterized protein
MTTVDSPQATSKEQIEPNDASAGADVAINPALLGLPAFIVGSVALGLVFVGYAPAGAAAALLSIVILGAGLGLVIATLWAARAGQGPVVAILGIMAMFWLSFPTLQLAIAHGWFGALDSSGKNQAVAVFALCWLIIVVVLTLATLRLPLAFTVLFALIDLALLLVFLANLGTGAPAAGLLQIAGVVVFLFAAIGVYMFFDAMTVALGANALPLGSPLVK